MNKDNIFIYDGRKKKVSFFLFMSGFFLFFLFIFWYIFSLKNSNNFIVVFLNSIISNVYNNINLGNLIGVFYSSLIGGLFFIIIPTEAVFVSFLVKKNNPFIIIPLYIFGFVISYSINYVIGKKIANISKKIITPKKFYKIKTQLNKYGGLLIFLFNLLPFPSQALSTILGVFKYNKMRFYFFFILGQIIKYSIISFVFFLF